MPDNCHLQIYFIKKKRVFHNSLNLVAFCELELDK